MRIAAEFGEYAAWSTDLGRLTHFARAETLAVARCETIFLEFGGAAMLDLTFRENGETVLLAGVIVDPNTLALNNGTPLLWPEIADVLNEDIVRGIEARVTPWLRTLVRGRPISGESIKRFAACPEFDAARLRGDFGAAPFRESLPGMAPFVYARRFARDRVVAVDCRHAARATAVLRDRARTVHMKADDPAAAAWFGIEPSTAPAEANVVIVESARDAPSSAQTIIVRTATEVPSEGWRLVPIPRPTMITLPFSFDEADAPRVGSFAVRSRDTVARAPRIAVRPQPAEGSSGRIALLVRSDAGFASGGDSDEAHELAVRLGRIGIEATVFTSLADARIAAPDLIHVFAAYGGDEWSRVAVELAGAGIPYVVTPAPLAGYTLWDEAAIPYVTNLLERTRRVAYRRAFSQRAMALPDGEASLAMSDELRAKYDAAFGALLRGAATVFAGPAFDVDGLCARFGTSRERVVAVRGVLLAPDADEEDVSAIVPADPFILIHAPVVTSSYLVYLSEVMEGSRVPLVFAGEMSDIVYGCRLQRRVIKDCVVVADPMPGTLSALYRRATIVADPCLRPSSPVRLLRAAASGALPALPSFSPFAALFGDAIVYDTSALDTTRSLLEAAIADPDCARRAAMVASRTAPFMDSDGAFLDILGGYARTAAASV